MPEPFVLLSYHRRDEVWKDRVVAKLESMVTVVSSPLRDDATPAWLEEREQALRSAGAAVLLVSRDSQASDYRTEVEEPLLRERCRGGGAVVLMLLIERLADAQALDGSTLPGTGGTVLSELSDADLDRQLERVGQTLHTALVAAPAAAEPVSQEDLDELFTRLYGDYFPALVGFFGRRGLDPDESRDLAQTTMFNVYRGLDRLQDKDSPRSWIRQIALNVWRNHVRWRWGSKKRGRPETSLERVREAFGDWSEGEALWSSGEPDPWHLISAAQSRARIAAAIPRLSTRQRECLVLWLEGYSYAQIAERLGVSIDAVKAGIHKAKAGIAKQVARAESTGERR